MALPYGVKVQYKGNTYDLTVMHNDGRTYLGSYNSIYGDWHCDITYDTYPTPYLRPMSSMTDEERAERVAILYELEGHIEEDVTYKYQEWLLEHHLDFMGLIPLAQRLK